MSAKHTPGRLVADCADSPYYGLFTEEGDAIAKAGGK